MPFPECTAMSQGYIGYHLQQAIDEELVSRGLTDIPVVSMLTQVVVDPKDPAFSNPTDWRLLQRRRIKKTDG